MGELKVALRDNKSILVVIFFTALVVRVAFSFFLQKYYFGELTFQYKDTPSYLLPILNLFERGVYQGDLFIEDSKYFRVPVYPFFLGIIHLVFGENYFDYAVAFIQSMIDATSAVLVYLIVVKISRSIIAARFSSAIYAFYPFVILWVPISYTETLQIFLMWSLLTHILYSPSSSIAWVVRGILCGLLILTKQYMGILLLIPLAYILFIGNIKSLTIAILALLIGISVVIAPWTARNYLHSGELIVLRGETTGLRSVGKDAESFYKFATLFDENATPAFYDVSHRGVMTFEKHPEFVARNQEEINKAVKLANQCGDSFVQMRHWVPIDEPPYVGCAEDVAVSFDSLTKKFWDEVNWTDAIETRLNAASKIFSKKDIVNKNLAIAKTNRIKELLFHYRVVLIVCGIVGAFLLIRQNIGNFATLMLLTAILMYSYFTIVIVHAEIRYFLIPDLLVTTFSGVALARAIIYFGNVRVAKPIPGSEV